MEKLQLSLVPRMKGLNKRSETNMFITGLPQVCAQMVLKSVFYFFYFLFFSVLHK